MKRKIAILLCAIAIPSVSHGQSDDLVGRWTVMATGLTFIGGAAVYIDLSIEKSVTERDNMKRVKVEMFVEDLDLNPGGPGLE